MTVATHVPPAFVEALVTLTIALTHGPGIAPIPKWYWPMIIIGSPRSGRFPCYNDQQAVGLLSQQAGSIPDVDHG